MTSNTPVQVAPPVQVAVAQTPLQAYTAKLASEGYKLEVVFTEKSVYGHKGHINVRNSEGRCGLVFISPVPGCCGFGVLNAWSTHVAATPKLVEAAREVAGGMGFRYTRLMSTNTNIASGIPQEHIIAALAEAGFEQSSFKSRKNGHLITVSLGDARGW